jgi:hypothetical protein
MEYIPNESKEGVYDVYLSTEGKKFYVLEGLSIEDEVVSPPIQHYIHDHYVFISTLYWLIFGIILTYLCGIHVVIPLMKRYGLH